MTGDRRGQTDEGRGEAVLGQLLPLRLAVVGATSSGKTTLINGLLGRRILPSDADELSAGLATFRPSRGGSELLVGEASGWNAGRHRLREDGDLERRLRSILFLAQHEGSQGTLEAPPRLEIRLPLSFCAHLLGLPEGYPIELIDAPGLRVQGDTKNIVDIIEALQGSLVVLVLDSSRTMNREELTEILELIQKHSELTRRGVGPLVVFNKIDRANTEDRATSAAQEEMRQLCSRALGREALVVPLAGLMFQRATELRGHLARWVTAAEEERELQALRSCLDASIQDVWGAIGKLTKPERPDRERLRAIEDAVENRELPPRVDLHWLADFLGETSGGTRLIRALREVAAQAQEAQTPDHHQALSQEVKQAMCHVAMMLGLMVGADGVVLQDELALASDLLDDFSLNFFGQSSPPATHIYLEKVARGECRDEVAPDGMLQAPARRWVFNALRSLMAVDREVHPDELQMLQGFSEWASAGRVTNSPDDKSIVRPSGEPHVARPELTVEARASTLQDLPVHPAMTVKVPAHLSSSNKKIWKIARSRLATKEQLEGVVNSLEREPEPRLSAMLLANPNTPIYLQERVRESLKIFRDRERAGALRRLIAGALMRLRKINPFFATLALFAEFQGGENEGVVSDGMVVFYSLPGRATRQHFDAVVFSGVLVAMLGHVVPRGSRYSRRWDLAVSVAVRGILEQQGTAPALTSLRLPDLELLPVEEIYKKIENYENLLVFVPDNEDVVTPEEEQRQSALETYWRQALAIAWQTTEPSRRPRLPGWLNALTETCQIEPALAEWLDPNIENPVLTKILTVHGEHQDFPRESSLRYALTVGLSLRVTSIEQALLAFRWLADRAAAEWLQLFVTNLLAHLEAKGLKGMFVVAVQQDARLRELVQETYALVMGGGRR